ncbi:hypothetical protein K9L16_02640 [Candidatus Pacearchaeota archaeon]|nr:hypothetical protein [Candidatus Pacearchaeota archaeon]
MSEKFYIPKDDDLNLFKVRTSDNAIIIPLDYFGYPNLHITLYVKELPEDKRLFDVHITKEKENTPIYNNHLEINVSETEKLIQNKLIEMNEDFVNLIKEHKAKSISKHNLLCLDCFVRDNQKFTEKINNKNFALEFYKGIFNKTIKFDIEELKKCPVCNNSDHNTFVDDEFTNMYVKNALGLFTFKDQVEFSNNLVNIIKNNFQEEFDRFNKIIEEIKIKLEGYRNGS